MAELECGNKGEGGKRFVRFVLDFKHESREFRE